MEEPPRIEKITSSRGISLSDTATILHSFIETLDQDSSALSREDTAKPVPAENATAAAAVAGSTNNWNTPRKTREQIEEETILKQFDLLSKQINSGLVSDDTYERLKLIRDSIAGEARGAPVLPSKVKMQDDYASENDVRGNFDDVHIKKESEEMDDGVYIKEEKTEIVDDSQQFVNELNEAEQEQRRREAKKLKKVKKSERKAKKKRNRESNDNNDDEKRIKIR